MCLYFTNKFNICFSILHTNIEVSYSPFCSTYIYWSNRKTVYIHYGRFGQVNGCRKRAKRSIRGRAPIRWRRRRKGNVILIFIYYKGLRSNSLNIVIQRNRICPTWNWSLGIINWFIHCLQVTSNSVTKEMLKNPALLSALQGKLDSMAGTTSGYIEVIRNLPT